LSHGIKDNDAYYCILSYPTVTLNFLHYTLFPLTVTNKSQWYNCFIRNEGNAIPKCSCPEVIGSNPTMGYTLLWDCNPFRGNSYYWHFSQEEARQIIPRRHLGNGKGTMI